MSLYDAAIKRHGVELSWEVGNIREMKSAARWLRQKAFELENEVMKLAERSENELEQEIEQHGESEDTLVQRRVSDNEEDVRSSSGRK